MSLDKCHLVLFFTRGVSLATWAQTGMLERELALYRAMSSHLESITLVSHGGSGDLDYEEHLGSLNLVCNHTDLPDQTYIRQLVEHFPTSFAGQVICKSNQVWGSEISLQVARRRGWRAVTRCGYLLSDFMEREHGVDTRSAKQARDLEEQVFRLADHGVVTTETMRHRLLSNYGLPQQKISVIPNYVLTDQFKPMQGIETNPNQVLFIGRLKEQKNPFALIEAFRDLDAELLMAGSGSLKVKLRRQIRQEQLPVKLLGNVPHLDLPELLNRAAIFVLPSHYEGHPKTLLEAMACGRPVVAADSSGIREQIRHEETGLLCGTDTPSILAAIQRLLNDKPLAERLGRNAREYILQNDALPKIVARERSLYQELLSRIESA